MPDDFNDISALLQQTADEARKKKEETSAEAEEVEDIFSEWDFSKDTENMGDMQSLQTSRTSLSTDTKRRKSLWVGRPEQRLTVTGGPLNPEAGDGFGRERGAAFEVDKAAASKGQAVKRQKSGKQNRGVCISASSQSRISLKEDVKPKRMVRVENYRNGIDGESKPRSIKASLAYHDSAELNLLKAKRDMRKARMNERLRNREARQAFRRSRERRGIKDPAPEQADFERKMSMARSEVEMNGAEEREATNRGQKKEKPRFENYFPVRDDSAAGPSGMRVEKRSANP